MYLVIHTNVLSVRFSSWLYHYWKLKYSINNKERTYHTFCSYFEEYSDCVLQGRKTRNIFYPSMLISFLFSKKVDILRVVLFHISNNRFIHFGSKKMSGRFKSMKNDSFLLVYEFQKYYNI